MQMQCLAKTERQDAINGYLPEVSCIMSRN